MLLVTRLQEIVVDLKYCTECQSLGSAQPTINKCFTPNTQLIHAPYAGLGAQYVGLGLGAQ